MMPSRFAFLRTILFVLIAGSICGARTISLAGPNVAAFTLMQGVPGFTTIPASPIDLGPSAVGVTTPHASPLPLQINNPGTAPLAVTNFIFPLGAAFTSETQFLFPVTIPAGSSFTPAVLFTPQAAGKQTIQASSLDNAPGNPHIVEFTGTGVAVPANDFVIILDPGSPSSVSVTAGSSTTFPIWLLAGPGLAVNFNSLQCSGGPTGTTCNLSDTLPILVGDSFGPTREEIMVTVTVPPKSASLHRSFALWGIASAATFVLLCWTRRTSAPLVALLLMSAFMVSCGGGSKPTGSPGLQVGSNSLVITATPRTGTMHALSVPLAVQ
jgi:hypothetical protein